MMRRSILSSSGRNENQCCGVNPGATGTLKDRGVALVITLLLLLLVSALGLAAVLSSSSDLLINGYYGNYRGSFYAADAGLSVARQSMQTYLAGLVPNGTTWNAGWINCSGSNQPIPSATWSNSYSSSTNLTGSSATSPAVVTNSWPESFKITTGSFGTLTCTPTSTGTGAPYVTYTIPYSLTSVGSATGTEQASVSENGSFVLVISTQGSNKVVDTSFSAFGAYIGSFPACNGSSLAYGTITGPVYANGEWNLGSGGSYTFTDPVNQTGSAFSFYDGSTCYHSTTVPYTDSKGTKFNPNFQAGFNLNQSTIQLPANSYSQMWAVLDGLGCGENNGSTCGSIPPTLPSQPTALQMNTYNMQNADQANAAANLYYNTTTSTAATSGVYIPYTCTGSTCSLTPNAGGIYVEDTSGKPTNLTLTAVTSGMYSSTTFPTSTQCTTSSCQAVQVTQTGSSTTGSATVSQTGSTSCTTTTHHSSTTTTCTANFTQSQATATPTTVTNITIDSSSNLTTAQTYVQTSTATSTQTASNSCEVSGSGGCTVTAPSFGSCSGSGCSTTTTTSNGSATDLTLAGVPTMSTSLGTPSTNSCTSSASGACAESMIYVDGSATITGPSSGAAVQNNSMLTVTANGNITQTGNLLYSTEPVTTSGSSLDSLKSLPTSAMYQVLGLFTANGEVVFTPSTSNLETDASIAVISSSSSCGSSCGKIATGTNFNTWTNVGGRAENSINSVGFSTGNVYFDQRYKQWNNFAPPWFPQTAIGENDLTNVLTTNQTFSVQRVQWYSSTGGQ